MKATLRTYIALTLSLLVVLTGQGMAASRGMDAAVGQMVICTGTGPIVVMVDENGQPTQAPAFCPEYALTLLGAVLPDEVALRPKTPVEAPAPARLSGALIPALLMPASARAPPVTI
ncbi:hypothetical protein J7426_02640 [Tropicibacter sp. R16_0]|uniref:hypothetical protein n=1 Tax=Tropicibacter sp. R16_0 TaxID=2821102 RepID=UPI001ADA53D4|nr:hypothetical protein [Tropicibacter sp. R16_0]MBO9449138.1 hypothetical protein [Tropicibacter sp. R16_0]